MTKETKTKDEVLIIDQTFVDSLVEMSPRKLANRLAKMTPKDFRQALDVAGVDCKPRLSRIQLNRLLKQFIVDQKNEMTADIETILAASAPEILPDVLEADDVPELTYEVDEDVEDDPGSLVGLTKYNSAAILNNNDAVIEAEIVTSELTPEEQIELARLEKIIDHEVSYFVEYAKRLGEALSAINKGRLYRSTHKTFALYVQDRFKMSTPYAYQLMTAAAIYDTLDSPELSDVVMPSIRNTLRLAQQVNHLTDIHEPKDAEQYGRTITRFVWRLVVETAPKSSKGDPLISPAHLDSVFNTLRGFMVDGAVEIDGEQIPLTIAQAAFDEAVTTESIERSARGRQRLAEEIEKTNERLSKSLTAPPRASLGTIVSGEASSVADQDAPTLQLVCSRHGETKIEAFIYAGLRLTCGCVFKQMGEHTVFGGSR